MTTASKSDTPTQTDTEDLDELQQRAAQGGLDALAAVGRHPSGSAKSS